MRRIWTFALLMLLITASCAGCAKPAQPEPSPGKTIQTEPDAPQEYDPPIYASPVVTELFQQLLDAGCPTASAEQVGAWLDAHPDYTDTVRGASCEYAATENGTERMRFLKTDCDRFSRFLAEASQTVVYQLWLVNGEIREGVSGTLEPLPTDRKPDETEQLAGFSVTTPLWSIDLTSLDGFYALDPSDANGTVSDCVAPDSGLSVYSNGPITLCFTKEAPGGPELLLHIHVQSGDAAYLGVRLGDSVDALIEALERQNTAQDGHWSIDRENCVADGYGHSIRFPETAGRITEFFLYAYV